MSLKGLEKRPRNICYILLLWNLACLPIIYWQNPCKLPMSFRCIKAFMHAFSGRFSRACLEGISFKFFVCFIFNVSLGSAPKRKNFDIQRNTRVGSGLNQEASLLQIDCQVIICCIDNWFILSRYSDQHDCKFDYKALGKFEIAKANPVVVAKKIVKI